MATINRAPQLMHTPEEFVPDTLGWDVSAAPPASQVMATCSLAPADQADTTLTITHSVDYTTDPTGAGGWKLLTSPGAWTGGPHGRTGTIGNPPPIGITSDTLPPGLKRLRLHVQPSRNVTETWSLTYS